MNSMKNTLRKIVAACMLYTDCIYSRILKFFKQANEFCSFLNGSLYELANPLWLWISGTEIVWLIYIFSVFIVQKCCVHTCMCRRLTSAGMRDTRLRVYEPWWKCLKLCSMKCWSCLGSILHLKQNCLQSSYNNLEFNTWTLPK